MGPLKRYNHFTCKRLRLKHEAVKDLARLRKQHRTEKLWIPQLPKCSSKDRTGPLRPRVSANTDKKLSEEMSQLKSFSESTCRT